MMGTAIYVMIFYSVELILGPLTLICNLRLGNDPYSKFDIEEVLRGVVVL